VSQFSSDLPKENVIQKIQSKFDKIERIQLQRKEKEAKKQQLQFERINREALRETKVSPQR